MKSGGIQMVVVIPGGEARTGNDRPATLPKGERCRRVSVGSGRPPNLNGAGMDRPARVWTRIGRVACKLQLQGEQNSQKEGKASVVVSVGLQVGCWLMQCKPQA